MGSLFENLEKIGIKIAFITEGKKNTLTSKFHFWQKE